MDEDRFVYVDGSILPRSRASFSIDDRGVLFGDGVYEVVAYYNGRGFAVEPHLKRLRESLRGVRISEPPELSRFDEISRELLARNGWADGKAYWQITRGAAPRDPRFPAVKPSLLVTTDPIRPLDVARPIPTLRAVIAEDTRWRRCCIKSLMLLPNILAYNLALDAGADAAILERDGTITEGTSSNVFLVRGGELWTPPLNGSILPGVTRAVVLELARSNGVPVREEPFRVDHLLGADEAFTTSTTTHLQAVVSVDGQTIGDGNVGPVTQRLYAAFLERVAQECGLAGAVKA